VLDQQFSRRRWRQCAGCALVGRGQLEQVATAILAPFARGLFGELVRAVAECPRRGGRQ
jgi:hypothetical protein